MSLFLDDWGDEGEAMAGRDTSAALGVRVGLDGGQGGVEDEGAGAGRMLSNCAPAASRVEEGEGGDGMRAADDEASEGPQRVARMVLNAGGIELTASEAHSR